MFSVFLLALALSVDAFAVAFSYGLVIKKDVASSAAKLGAATGAGQFVMPLLGWLATVPSIVTLRLLTIGSPLSCFCCSG